MTSNLTPAEERILDLVRSLKPYERIEIKLQDNQQGLLSITTTGTTKETFPQPT